MRIVKAASVFIVVALLSACAVTGPKYSEIAASIPPVPSGKGRIYFYRPDTLLGAAVTSDISLNGKVVGRSERGGFFFVDQAPGSCKVATSTEVEKQLTFKLEPGQTRYVRTTVSMGVLVGRINAELVSADTGKADITELAYMGTPPTKK